jgi:hypothetical protein
VFLDLGFQVYDKAPLKFLKGGVRVMQPFLITPFPPPLMVQMCHSLYHISMGMALYKNFVHHVHGRGICLGVIYLKGMN